MSESTQTLLIESISLILILAILAWMITRPIDYPPSWRERGWGQKSEKLDDDDVE